MAGGSLRAATWKCRQTFQEDRVQMQTFLRGQPGPAFRTLLTVLPP